MLRINRQTDYAVRVILALAEQDGSRRISSAQVRDTMLIPESFMPRIVAQLAKSGLIKTFMGRDGGLLLGRPAEEITLKDVVEVFEGPIMLSECMEAEPDDECPYKENCHVRSKWGRVQAAMLREMASISFADLALESRSNSTPSFIPGSSI